ncbi:MAG: glycosyltransferase family 4 protein [Gemmatimonadota bacterium]
MKILYIAFAGTDQSGVHRKLAEQVSALRACGQDVQAIVFADTRVAPAPANAPYHVVNVAGGGFGVPGRALAMHACWEAMDQFAPDVVYMRYPIYDGHVLRFVREAPPVVFELQTIFANEAPKEAADFEARWATRVLLETAGLVGVTGEILEHETGRAGWDIPGHVMANGADPESIPFTTPALAADRVDLLCVASFYPWHGLDRIIVGFAAEPDVGDVHLHLVGDGPTLPALRTLADEAGVSHRVHFHGHVPVSELGRWYPRAHVAIGSLAPHRVGLRELAALKHREYALRGLPMVLAGGDVDFPTTLPWMRQIASDDSPVSPRMLRALAHAWSHAARRRQIRAWAETHVSWSVKVPRLVDFLEHCRQSALSNGTGSPGAARTLAGIA